MPRRFNPYKKPFFERRSRPSRPAPGRYDFPGDGVLEAPGLALEKPFRFGAEFARRLALREVNPKEAFTVRDPSGAFYRASLKELDAGGGAAVPYERCASPEPAIELTLACAVLARQRMIFVIQKATELGVARVVPLLTEHSVPAAGLEHEKAHAWPGQILRAAKQCRRGSLPALEAPAPLDGFLDSPAMTAAELRVCLDNVSGAPLAAPSSPRRVLLLVGPEGGFSEPERKKLEERGALPWTLGGRVLRAETAVLVGLAAVHLRWGDFRSGILPTPA